MYIENEKVKPETIMIDRSNKVDWEHGLLELYKQTVQHKTDLGIRSQYIGELKMFSAEFPGDPDIVKSYNEKQITNEEFSPALLKKGHEVELKNLHQAVIDNPADLDLQAALTQETAIFVRDHPEPVPSHIKVAE